MILTENELSKWFFSDRIFLLAIFNFYWRKIDFIGDNEQVIGENQFLLATWKFSMIFFNSLLVEINPQY
jgi:hypothetical protein